MGCEERRILCLGVKRGQGRAEVWGGKATNVRGKRGKDRRVSGVGWVERRLGGEVQEGKEGRESRRR